MFLLYFFLKKKNHHSIHFTPEERFYSEKYSKHIFNLSYSVKEMKFLKVQVFVTSLKTHKHEERFLEFLVTRFTENL